MAVCFKKLRIYLDTSVINFLFAKDVPDFRRITEDFFEVYAQQCELYGSDVLLEELDRDPDECRKQRHMTVLRDHGVKILPRSRDYEVAHLADSYLQQQVVPFKKRDDALHVAYATVFEMDVLLSWNFKHLANIRREARFVSVNQAEGYWRTPRIVSPMEVEDEED
jgi:hypothetical protein